MSFRTISRSSWRTSILREYVFFVYFEVVHVFVIPDLSNLLLCCFEALCPTKNITTTIDGNRKNGKEVKRPALDPRNHQLAQMKPFICKCCKKKRERNKNKSWRYWSHRWTKTKETRWSTRRSYKLKWRMHTKLVIRKLTWKSRIGSNRRDSGDWTWLTVTWNVVIDRNFDRSLWPKCGLFDNVPSFLLEATIVSYWCPKFFGASMPKQ